MSSLTKEIDRELPPVLSDLRTRQLFVIQLEVRPLLQVGGPADAYRRVGIVSGGEFKGSRLSGDVLDGGNDWQTARADHSTKLDVRLPLRTHDGALICMTYGGIRSGDSQVLARFDRGEQVDPAAYYCRIAPVFETADRRYQWLNQLIAVGIGDRTEAGPFYNIFEVL